MGHYQFQNRYVLCVCADVPALPNKISDRSGRIAVVSRRGYPDETGGQKLEDNEDRKRVQGSSQRLQIGGGGVTGI